ncbi:MAG: hypothetical protein ACRDOI_04020 [Trebonia sp.]
MPALRRAERRRSIAADRKLTGALGTNMREWFVNALVLGQKGSADLVAYFFLRAMSLLTNQGNLGLIATNAAAQGDTREVGLDQLVREGFTITRAIQSRSRGQRLAPTWSTRQCGALTVTSR